MIQSHLQKIAEEIALSSIIDYTKEELLTPSQAEILKKCIIENAEVCMSPLISDEDFIP
jgi:hypothetical protein